jgi:segregation and condensation protein B
MDELSLDYRVALIGTILFLESEPIDEAGLARIAGLSHEEVAEALQSLSVEHEGEAHGFAPIRSGGGWIFAPKMELWEKLKDHYGKKNEAKLSRAAMETLSIVAYSQPITRAEIEAIRGVSADGMIRYLLSRGLVKEVGKKDVPGKPMQYGTTVEFLKYFKLGSISELPPLSEIEKNRFAKTEGEQG